MAENQTDPLIKINELLEEIKDRLNKTEETEGKGKEYTLHIEDNRSSSTSNRTEDIELKIRSLWMSRK
jgi:hypothetical protein